MTLNDTQGRMVLGTRVEREWKICSERCRKTTDVGWRDHNRLAWHGTRTWSLSPGQRRLRGKRRSSNLAASPTGVQAVELSRDEERVEAVQKAHGFSPQTQRSFGSSSASTIEALIHWRLL